MTRKRKKDWLAAIAMFAGALGSTSAHAQYADAVLADNPVGYWRFNDNSLDTAANLGTAGDAYEGVYIGGAHVPAATMTLADGRVVTGLGGDNTAYRVGDDIDEYVTIEESLLSDLAEFSMSAWVYTDALTANRIGLFGQNDAVEFGFINPTQIQLWTPAGQVLNYAVDPDVIQDETWFHLAAVADGSRIRLFINGEPTEAGPAYGRSTFPFNIGGGGIYDGTGNQFTGTLDEVAVFDRALSESQIQAHVQAGRAAGGDYAASVLADNPLGYWSLDEETGTTAVNRGTGGDAYNGVFVGGSQGAPGADEANPGFAAGNAGFAVEAPDDGYVTVADSPTNGLGEFTLSGWVKPGFIDGTRVGLFGQNDALEFGLIDPNTIQMWTPNGGAVNLPLAGEIAEDEWVHIAATGDGEEIVVYVNGEALAFGGSPIDTGGGNPVDSYGASDFFFNIGGGGIYDGTGNQFTGILDEVAVFDYALTDAQVRAQFQASLGSAVEGDFDGDGQLTAADLNLMAAGMVANDPQFDLNGDGMTDLADRTLWVTDLKNTYMGDANLDGEFNSGDLVEVFSAGLFETGQAAGWSEGDWNGDLVFNSSDFVTAFTGGGYEAGPRAAVAAVPEPSTAVLGMFAGLLAVGGFRKR